MQEHADVDLTEKEKHVAKVEVVEKIMTEVVPQLNLSIKFLPPAKDYGLYNESEGRWTGILGNLSREDIDIAFAHFGISTGRLESFDFTLPIYKVHNELYIKSPERYMVKWNAYAKVLSNRKIIIKLKLNSILYYIFVYNLKT